MNSLQQKITYLLRSVANVGQKRKCPYCGGTSFTTIDTKYGITALLKCNTCALQHRHPRDSEAFLNKFYQTDYEVDVQMMTDLPDEAKLRELMADNFSELRDYSSIIRAAVKGEGPVHVIDYGCSWGYNVYKLNQAGMKASGYELSVPRAEYGRKHLGIDLVHTTSDIPAGNDVFFSAHTIEHLADIGKFVELAREKLTSNGVFIASCPNGSDEYRKREPHTFHVTWGSVHPSYLDIEFAQFLFKDHPHLILTSNWPHNAETIAAWDGASQLVSGPRDGNDLLILAKPNVWLKAH